MKINIYDNGYEIQKDILERTIKNRIPMEQSEDGLKIELCINNVIGAEESYQIVEEDGGWKIIGSDEAGLIYGIGKFLHTAKWSEEDFVPMPPTGVVSPDCDFRATYFSIHFHNWYYTAPTQELEQYVEDIMLWGYNTIVCIVPVVCFESCDEPAFFDAVNKIQAEGGSIAMLNGKMIGPPMLKRAKKVLEVVELIEEKGASYGR